nr:2-dehydropantoate 2-reductase [Paraburkholderia hospita]
MKIAILGAGALGCAIGAALTEGGNEVWLLNRSAAHVETMRRDGLRVDDANGSRRVEVKATTRAAEVGAVDLVVVLVKSFHTDAAMRGALALIGPDTLVLSLQNGLGHEDVLADIVGRGRVLAGKTYVGGVMRNPGHIESGVAGKATYIGELGGGITSRVMAIAETFNAAGLATTVSDNIVGTMWDKLLVNVATGALTGTTGLTYGQLYDEPLLKTAARIGYEPRCHGISPEVFKASRTTLHSRVQLVADQLRTRGHLLAFSADGNTVIVDNELSIRFVARLVRHYDCQNPRGRVRWPLRSSPHLLAVFRLDSAFASLVDVLVFSRGNLPPGHELDISIGKGQDRILEKFRFPDESILLELTARCPLEMLYERPGTATD